MPPMRAQDFSEIEDWPGYFGAVLGKEPRETLVRALDLFTDEGFAGGLAVDIAAGEGRDTLELLKRGWNVVATDGHPEVVGARRGQQGHSHADGGEFRA